MQYRFRTFLISALILSSVIAPASALEYRYSADLYDNYFYTPTSSNDAIAIDSKSNNGGTPIVVQSASMATGNSSDDTSMGSSAIPLGSYIDPWGDTVSAGISAAEEANGLAGLSFNPLINNAWYNGTNKGMQASAGFTERSQLSYTAGHFGAVSIGNRGLFAYVYPSASSESMQKGAGHVDGTSAWNGNVVLCGHNRGSWPHFSTLKNVKPGDQVTYKTSLGTRVYRVVSAGPVGTTDTSVLNPTSNNQITLLTCIANEPNYRFCVVAQEMR